jgi:GT2 family glycosyltransferase/2-polyprenyl-3-methyl-5-hydroxy-6-metoxy-1,4-benzoquinol methylase
MNNSKDWHKNYPSVEEITEESLDENSSLKKMLRFIGSNKQVVDFGCATGYFAQLLKQHDCTVTGVEINPDAAKIAEKYCQKVIVADLDFVSVTDILPNKEFDVAVFGDVLEHLRNPWKVLEETKKILKEDGFVVASIPNIAHGAIRLALLQGQFEYNDFGILDNTHLRFFTRKTIESLFKQSGYILQVIDRTKLGVFSVSPYIPQLKRNNFGQEVIEHLQTDENADTLQFIVKAVRANPEETSAIPTLPIEIDNSRPEPIPETETERLQIQLQQTQAELEQKTYHLEETFKNIQTERKLFESQLEQTQTELAESRSLLQQTQAELEQKTYDLEETFKNIQTERKLFESQLQQTQAELEQKTYDLEETFKNIQTERKLFESQLQQAQTELAESRSLLQQTQTELEQKNYHLEETFKNIQTERKLFESQLQQTQTELAESRSLLQQTQAELEQLRIHLQKTLQNIEREREQKHLQIQDLQTKLDQIHKEEIKNSSPQLTNKIKTKAKQKLIPQKKAALSPAADESLLEFSGINQERFWEIINPIIEKDLSHSRETSPRISILTPTWNSSLDWFVETAASVFEQTLANWEWCIVDDGSKNPEILAVVKELARKHPQVKVFLQAINEGISSATNKALELAIGEFVCFLDHDDTLAPMAIEEFTQKLTEGFDVVYSDEDKIDISGRHYTEPFYKPNWSPEYFRGVMYVGHLLCVRRELALKVGGFNSEFNGVQDYEFMLRISEATNKIAHIPKILYHWRKISGSIAADVNAKQGIEQLQVASVNAHLKRLNLPAKAESARGNHRIKLVPKSRTSNPLISIIIPTKDAPEYLGRCLKSIFSITIYPNYEIILVDNETTHPKALQIMEEYPVKRIPLPNPFNFSRANNLGVKSARGDYIVCLNNDTEVISPDWLEHLLYYAEQEDIGAVGPLLLYPDKTVQHAGIVTGFRGTADHLMRGFPCDVDGYAGSLACSREVSAVTAACLMLKKIDFDAIGGFKEHFFTHYQDVDLCLELVKCGKRNIYTPQAVLIHHESKSRKNYYDMVDRMLLLDLHQQYIDLGDPYYNPNFDIAHYDYTIRT